MMEVIGAKDSRAFRVLWMLEELGESYCHTPAYPHSREVLVYNPGGKIPVFVAAEDDMVLTDSTAILHYLADRKGHFSFPPGDKRRSLQDSWTYLILDEIDQCIWTAAKHTFVLPEARRMKGIKSILRWEFQQAIKRIAARLNGKAYLMGGAMTVPDFIFGHCLLWAERAKFTHEEAAIDAYFKRICDRTAFQRTTRI